MKVLITGSRGMLGRSLWTALKRRGHELYGFDKSDGRDVLDAAQVEKACAGMEVVVHLAAVIDEGNPKLWEINVKGTRNVLEAAAKNRVSRVVLMSSCGVYGSSQTAVIDEETPMAPDTPYEKSKAEAEKIAEEYQEVVSVTIVRAPIVLGPSGYWVKIIKLATSGFPLIGSGENRWPVVYVEDLVSALALLVEKSGAEGETYVVSGRTTTLLDLVRALRKARGLKSDPVKLPEWLGKILAMLYNGASSLMGKRTLLSGAYVERMVRDRAFNTKKIEALGWKAKMPLEKGVARVVKMLE